MGRALGSSGSLLRRRAVCVATASVLLALMNAVSPLSAADRGIFGSIKLGTTDVDQDFDEALGQVIDGDDDSLAYELGFRFSRFFRLQAGYHDLGSFPGAFDCADLANCTDLVVPVEAEARAYSVAAVPRLPLLFGLSVFAKAGVAHWESEVRSALPDDDSVFDERSDTDLIYGAGVGWEIFGPLAIFAEWERIGDEVETISLGLTVYVF